MKKTIIFLTLLFSLMIVFSSCGADNSKHLSDSGKNNSDVEEKTDAEIEEAEVTLKLWMTLVPEQGEPDRVQEFIDAYAAEHQNVKIEPTLIAWADLRTMLTPAIKSGEGPDVFNYTPGPGYTGVLAEAGLIMQLDEAAEKYGWNNMFPEWFIEQQKIDGKLWGISNAQTLLGVFYNKSVYDELDLEIPNTYEEFVENCEIIKEEKTDITPLVFDMKDQWPAFHYGTAFYGSFAGTDKLREVEETKKGWDSEEFIDAHQAMLDLINNGLATKDPNGLASADSNVEFISGKAAMRLTGTWMIPEFGTKMGDNVGFFALPPVKGIEPGLVGGSGDQMIISSKTEYPDAALDLVDAILKDINIWMGSFGTPAMKGLSDDVFNGDKLQIDAYNTISEATGVASITDVVMPQEFNDIFKTEYQRFLAGKLNAEELSKKLQEALN